MHFCSLTGTKAQGWACTDVPAQCWPLKRVSRTGAEINTVLKANKYIGAKFESYQQDGLCDAFPLLPSFPCSHFVLFEIRYIVLPQRVRNDIYNGTGLRTTRWCEEIFDGALNEIFAGVDN